MRHALSLPPFGQLSDVSALGDLAARAEQQEWDGFFLWDHILRPDTDPVEIADTWIALTGVAAATERITIGPMVTPITRRRPQKLAREAATLDRFSNGRLVLGLGLGVDSGGELSRFGEIVDPRTRGARLDEGVELLCRYWSGETVDFHGEHFQADHVLLAPSPAQSPRVPLWFAVRGGARRPTLRAARYDGMFPIEVDIDGLRSLLDVVVEERGSLDGFDVAVHSGLAETTPVETLASLGVTWLIHSTSPRSSIADVELMIDTSR